MDNKKGNNPFTYGGITSGGHTPLTYNTYLMVDELKKLQVVQSDPPHHDEPLFIIIHQTYELWFKLIIHELDLVVELMNEGRVRKATHFMRRVVAIMKVLVQQIHILETMSPRDFLGFRDKLNPASGFQSSQFREIEFLAGLKEERFLTHFQKDTHAHDALVKRFNDPSLQDVFYNLLRRDYGMTLPEVKGNGEDQDQDKDLESAKSAAEKDRIQELLPLYNEDPRYTDLHDLAETFVDLDELISLWRTHHVTVVERIIGFKRGTGGSEGVGYLRSTVTKRCFPDLWNLRTELVLN